MAVMTEFTTHEAFPLERVNRTDRRFMSRLDREAWDTQVTALMAEITQHGLMNPVGLVKPAAESSYVVMYGFTRTEAVSRLGWSTIRANVYEDLDDTTARMLNAGDNAWHQQLTDWERALQLRKLRASGLPVESAIGEPCLTRLLGMSRRTVFNWLRIVEYEAPALHQAIADKKIGLQQALVFRDYAAQITEEWIARCIEGEWSSSELKLRLSAAMDGDPEPKASTPTPESATMHSGVSSEPIPMRATMHGEGEGVDQQLSKAGQWLLRVSSAQIQQLSGDEQRKLKEGLRAVLEVIAAHKLIDAS
jgi:ParB-like chromosome segregation protein Spo0J